MKPLVFIPTLNEFGTIENLLSSINRDYQNLDIFVIDDNSSDGTLEVLEMLKTRGFPLTFVNRGSKLGIGSAHIQALNFAKMHEYDVLLTMDADGAHDPIFIKDFLREISNYDVVVGSRYLNKDSLSEWKIFRKLLTRSVHFLTRVSLGLKYDSSSGFRCYRMDRIPESIFSELKSTGYDFFFESMYEMSSFKIRISEISISLPARTYGHSKMTPKLALSALKTLMYVSLRRIRRLGR